MGNSQSGISPSEDKIPQESPKPKCKPCCACPETRDKRDKCVMSFGEEGCVELIKEHQECMRKMGFNI